MEKNQKVDGLRKAIGEDSREVRDPAGRNIDVVDDRTLKALAERFECSIGEVSLQAMGIGIWPLRYIRNLGTFTLAEQGRLAESKVAVVGAGGLGGQVILLLARTGVGHLTVIDHDLFDETNLNRQMLATVAAVGRSKAKEAERAVAAVNPGVTVVSIKERVTGANAESLLTGADLVVDALDNVSDRLTISDVCKGLGVPLVHGALAGLEGQVMSVFPDDPGLSVIYGDKGQEENKGMAPEALLGVPGLTPAIIGTLQAMEVIKILLNRGRVLKNTMLHADLESGEFNRFRF